MPKKKKKEYETQYIFFCPNCNFDWTDEKPKSAKIDHTCPNCDTESELVDKFDNMLNFSKYYTTTLNPIHPEEEDKFDTHGEEMAFVESYDQNHVWTVVEGDSGALGIIKGLHYVNRLFYLITKESHEGDYEQYYY